MMLNKKASSLNPISPKVNVLVYLSPLENYGSGIRFKPKDVALILLGLLTTKIFVSSYF